MCGETRVLLVAAQLAEIRAERADTFAVDLLPAANRAVELALGDPARALDPGAPRELLVSREREEVRERCVAAGPSAERAPGVDQRGIERERTEQAIDVVGDTQRGAARVGVERWNQSVGRGFDDRILMRVEKVHRA